MKAALVACSNGQSRANEGLINQLTEYLRQLKIDIVEGKFIYARDGVFSGSAKERADDLMNFYTNEKVDFIFDVSGGDIANEIIPYLDFNIIRKSETVFFGYSDLTTVINAMYTETGKYSVLYQVKNLVWGESDKVRELQQQRFKNTFRERGTELFDISYDFLQGNKMDGILVGGNIRCLLKLAGTPYMPDMRKKVLLLEARGGEAPQLATYFSQLEQMGVFQKVSGVILGTFTCYENSVPDRSVYELLKPHIHDGLPVAKTKDVGHGFDSKAVKIGCYVEYKI